MEEAFLQEGFVITAKIHIFLRHLCIRFLLLRSLGKFRFGFQKCACIHGCLHGATAIHHRRTDLEPVEEKYDQQENDQSFAGAEGATNACEHSEEG